MISLGGRPEGATQQIFYFHELCSDQLFSSLSFHNCVSCACPLSLDCLLNISIHPRVHHFPQKTAVQVHCRSSLWISEAVCNDVDNRSVREVIHSFPRLIYSCSAHSGNRIYGTFFCPLSGRPSDKLSSGRPCKALTSEFESVCSDRTCDVSEETV